MERDNIHPHFGQIVSRRLDFFARPYTQQYSGNLLHLERGSGLVVRRGDAITEESMIKSLISLVYTHGGTGLSDTPGTYKKN